MMSLSHHNREEETLLDYFRQMLSEEEAVMDASGEAPAVKAALPESPAVEPDARGDLPVTGPEPELQTAPEVKSESRPLDYAPQPSLESLLMAIGTEPVSATATETATATAVDTATETATAVDTATETATAVDTATETATAVDMVTETETVTETATAVAGATDSVTVKDTEKTVEILPGLSEAQRRAFSEWKNIEPGREFQTLFFTVGGVRFAVPLVDLGSIFECQKTTFIFGQPQWFMGMTDIRGKKINIVDTLRFVKEDYAGREEPYPYIITLGTSRWAITCDVLEGNRTIQNEAVKWRQSAGNRPWLAGIVKKEMCALLHVETLVQLFESGFNPRSLGEIKEQD